MRRTLFGVCGGAATVPGTPEQFGGFVKTEMVKWAAVIKRAGIKPD